MGALSWTTSSAVETKKLGERIARTLPEPCVVALIGDLGAGKTTFVKGFAKGLGVLSKESEIVSPTFVLVREYRGRFEVRHFDWYRLDRVSGQDELQALDTFYSGAVCLVEWADRGKGLLPEDHVQIRFTHAGRDKREIALSVKGRRFKGWLKEISTKI